MDGDLDLNISQEELARLSPQDQRELVQFVQEKQQQSNVQRTIHEFAETCFKKCIRGSITSGQLTSKENTCMSNCVNRFMDSNLAILQHLEQMRMQQ